MSLTFADATTDNINVAAASSINNLSTVTVLMCVNLTSITPGSQRNYWGKSTVGNRFVAIIGAANNIQVLYAGGTANAIAIADNANLPNYGSGKWIFVATTLNFGTTAPKIFTGDLTHVLAEASAYNGTPNAGSGTHDDSADGWAFMSSNGGGNSMGGKLAFVMVWNRVLTLAELIEQQFRPHKTSGCVVYIQAGWNGTGTQPDWSGNANSASVTGATLTPDHVPLGPAFSFGREWEGAFKAAAAPSVKYPQLERHTRGVARGILTGVA